VKSPSSRAAAGGATGARATSAATPKRVQNLTAPAAGEVEDDNGRGSLGNLSTRVNASSSDDDVGGVARRSASPAVSDDEEAERRDVLPDDHPTNRLLTNVQAKVNKRSESDGIVVTERPRPDKPVRRCESTDNAADAIMSSSPSSAPGLEQGAKFRRGPESIKTVAPATIVEGPADAAVAVGDKVSFRAHYFGNPEPRVVWSRNGVHIKPSDAAGGWDRAKVQTYSGESTLVVTNLRPDDSGKYQVTIENEVGSDAATASLSVEGPPEPPAGRPFVSDVSAVDGSLTLAWYGSTFDGGSCVTGYAVEASSRPKGSSVPHKWTTLEASCHSTSYIAHGLKVEHEYLFRVRAANVHGLSNPGDSSETVFFVPRASSRAKSVDAGLPEALSGEGANEDDDADLGLENDPTFLAPFQHRVVATEQGSIFKSKYGIYEELGRGRFGVVFKVEDKETGEHFAAKFIRCRKQEERQKVKRDVGKKKRRNHRAHSHILLRCGTRSTS